MKAEERIEKYQDLKNGSKIKNDINKTKLDNYNIKSDNDKESSDTSKGKNVSVDNGFDNNIFGFVIEEKFKLLNYTYEYIDKVYEDIENFPKKHEIIKNKLVETSFELLEKISSGNYSHNKKYKKQMADEAVGKIKTLYFLLHMLEKDKMISSKKIHKLRLNLDNISKCLVGWRRAI